MSAPVVYRAFDASGALLYVGVSTRGLHRLHEHRGKPWFKDIATVGVQHFETNDEAWDAEVAAIDSEAPLHNRMVTRARVQAEPSRSMSLAEAARWFGVCDATLRRWVLLGAVPASRFGARGQRRFLLADLEEFIASRTTAVEASA